MNNKYPEYKGLNLPEISKEIQESWDRDAVFDASMSAREGAKPFVFFEGPPSANGMPGIHHVMARSIKDIFCRFKTLKGFLVKRKAGWDTHGLPVELGVEKELGITKEDIGKKISVDAYNTACKKAVMKYTDVWNDLTKKMGYWVDMDDPYVTYKSKYMESVWWLIAELYRKDLLYKGYTIQPYSPKAGTGLSSHEINQPGCYKDVKDTSAVAQFKVIDTSKSPFKVDGELFLLAWTTTPWTLPSNTALTVGEKIEYVCVTTFNQYTFKRANVVLAKSLVSYQFSKGFFIVDNINDLEAYEEGAKKIPFYVGQSCTGKDLLGLRYEQLLDYCLPAENPENAFQVISGDFVTTEDGTGIVHTAPTFGADDAKVAKEAGVPPMLVRDEYDNLVPLVDLQGRFRKELAEFAGMYVKNEYYPDGEAPDKSADVELSVKLKLENRAFKVEKYEHSYPHCWRTDKPILYYPLDSWFIKVTEHKERMVDLNNTINWKPESTGTGRFGKWLENANDWNLSRSRYWGIPIPIWRTEDGLEQKCIGSVEQLKEECQLAVEAGIMDTNPLTDFIPGDMSDANYSQIDLHKHIVDSMVLVSDSGKPMNRESDLMDVWFDSGSMPYAQWHYPFENKEKIENNTAYPADFIAEGVDQTRGWFYTLHAISSMVFGKVAYKNVVSNGLVLDKKGQKMSKRLGNGVDPFETLAKYGPDATRWYMITNAQPWDNLKFDIEGIVEVQRKFFGTLYNTYSFFSLYANVDEFDYSQKELPLEERPEIDRWVLSKLHSLVQNVEESYSSYEPTRAGRAIQEFVTEQLSNWYVRLCRRRFWKNDDPRDKIAAYQTLYTCLETVAIIASPIAPFFMDRLYLDLNKGSQKSKLNSVHLADFPNVHSDIIQENLEKQMELAQRVCSLVLGLRKKERIRVRQPLQKIMVPVLNVETEKNLNHVRGLILSEVNVKELEMITEDNEILVKSIKPNFKTIGPKYGKHMKAIAAIISGWTAVDISELESRGNWKGDVNGDAILLDLNDFVIATKDIPGWLVANEDGITVALDISISPDLKSEGIARELVNRVQNLRKEKGLEVTDRISLVLETNEVIQDAIERNKRYVADEVLASDISFEDLNGEIHLETIEVENDLKISLKKKEA
ncbi:MAG: isoleucine--tRNA ligase [Crocinitomicaceae bacterium]|nr:isoleucine--tRNA ligase [Crocinitomicaceae bacterium]